MEALEQLVRETLDEVRVIRAKLCGSDEEQSAPVITNAPMTIEEQRSYKYQLGLELPPELDTCGANTSFKRTTYGFPHQISENHRTNERELIVDNRSSVTIVARLQNRFTHQPANEYDLSGDASARFKLSLVYASTGAEVLATDLTTTTSLHLFDPPSTTDERLLVNGSLNFTFKCNFTSRAAKTPGGHKFCFRIVCVSPELKSIPWLRVTSPEFRVISRPYVKAKKKRTLDDAEIDALV